MPTTALTITWTLMTRDARFCRTWRGVAYRRMERPIPLRHEDSISTVKSNLVANFAGRGWRAVLQILLLPLYVRLLGIESYALVGFYNVLLAVFLQLELGLGTTFNREIAQRSARAAPAAEFRDMLRTLEFVYWGVAACIGLVVVAGAPLIAEHWLRAQKLSTVEVQHAVVMMGLVMAAQWPISLYEGGLRGTQRQVLLNVIGGSMATLRGIGALAVLYFVSPTITAFFAWQVAVNLLHTVLLSRALWRALPTSAARPQFQRTYLSETWRFAAGISGVSLLSLGLMQLDKILLSRLLPLKAFGYYTIATTIAGTLALVSGPLFEAIFPRFSDLVTRGDEGLLRRLYHAGCQFTAALVFPAAAALVLFAEPIVAFWMHDADMAAHTHLLVALLAIGTAANVVMMLPLALQFAYGWTKLSFYKNLIALAIIVPLLVYLVQRYGAVGAAVSWIVVNVGYIIFEIPYMHRRILRGSTREFYLRDLGLPLTATVIVFGASAALVRWVGDRHQIALAIAAAGLATGLATATVPAVRRQVAGFQLRRIADHRSRAA